MKKNRLLKESDHQLIFDAYQFIGWAEILMNPNCKIQKEAKWLAASKKTWLKTEYLPLMDRLANWMRKFPEDVSNKKCGASSSGRTGRRSKLKK